MLGVKIIKKMRDKSECFLFFLCHICILMKDIYLSITKIYIKLSLELINLQRIALIHCEINMTLFARKNRSVG